LGVVTASYIAHLCESTTDSEIDTLTEYITIANQDELRPNWKSTITFEVRQIDDSFFLLGLDDTSLEALEDILSMQHVCSVTENGVVSTAVYSWGIDRINQANLPLDLSSSSAWTGQGIDVYVLATGLVSL